MTSLRHTVMPCAHGRSQLEPTIGPALSHDVVAVVGSDGRRSPPDALPATRRWRVRVTVCTPLPCSRTSRPHSYSVQETSDGSTTVGTRCAVRVKAPGWAGYNIGPRRVIFASRAAYGSCMHAVGNVSKKRPLAANVSCITLGDQVPPQKNQVL